MSELEQLRKAADKCYESCSDYSCVRRGDCGGKAGHAWRQAQHEAERQREQDASDCKLAEQINRLKRAGAI